MGQPCSINHLERLHRYGNCIIKQCDVTDQESLNKIIEAVANNMQIEGLINCAGIAVSGDFIEISQEDIENMILVNTQGLTNAIYAVLPYLRKAQSGTVINLSSLADRYPRPHNAIYAASKSFVRSFSDSLRLSEAKNNIRVCNLSPAFIETPMLTSNHSDIEGKTIPVFDFVSIVQFMYSQPQNICIRDLVVAPTSYEG
jgi:NADP-dependent 3-hydroxy acid dehydrogenase YdfG